MRLLDHYGFYTGACSTSLASRCPRSLPSDRYLCNDRHVTCSVPCHASGAVRGNLGLCTETLCHYVVADGHLDCSSWHGLRYPIRACCHCGHQSHNLRFGDRKITELFPNTMSRMITKPLFPRKSLCRYRPN